MLFEHLPPQTAISNLVGATQNNYSVAASYYAQKRAIFKQVLEQNHMKALEFEPELNQLIADVWNKEIMNVLRGIYFDKKTNLDQKREMIKKHFDTSPYIDQFLEAIQYGNPQVFFSKLGFVFEDWLQQAMQIVINKGSDFGSSHADQLITAFHTGAMKSVASAVKGNQYIRPDIIVALSNVTFEQDENQVLRDNSGILVEMQGELNIDYEHIMPSANEIMTNSEFLQKLLNGNFFGFSAKLWSKSNGKGFMSSSVMRDSLNSVFNQTDSHGNRHPWEIDYTSEYVVYELSKNIFHIVGPTDIAMILGNGITWMDDFLSAHIFYMRVQVENYQQAKTEGLIFPQITDSEIYLRNYKTGTAIAAFKSQLHKTKKYGNYIDLKLIM